MATQALLDIGNVILEPSPTFARLKARTNAWVPLVVMIALTLGVVYWWIATVDMTWLRDQVLAAQTDPRPEARAMMERFLTPRSMMVTTGIGTLVGVPLVTAVLALYYLAAGKVIGAPIAYGKWFGFAVWTSVPALLKTPLSALQILTSHGHVAQEGLNMVSLNYLVFHLPATNHWATLLSTLDLAQFWSIALAAIGLKVWTGRPTGVCITVALLPTVVIFGVWAAKLAFLG